MEECSTGSEAQGVTLSQSLRGRSAANLRRVGLAVDFIENNLEGDLSLRRLAGLVNLSRFHFARAFKAVTGATVHAHVTERRLLRARDLLCGGDRTLCEVALMCGFASQGHLCALFKKRFGVTPGQCRSAYLVAGVIDADAPGTQDCSC
jgi:AraC family transcriptional regulator